MRLTTLLTLSGYFARALAALTARSMRLQCTIQDGQVWITDGTETVSVEPERLMGPRD